MFEMFEKNVERERERRAIESSLDRKKNT